MFVLQEGVETVLAAPWYVWTAEHAPGLYRNYSFMYKADPEDIIATKQQLQYALVVVVVVLFVVVMSSLLSLDCSSTPKKSTKHSPKAQLGCFSQELVI